MRQATASQPPKGGYREAVALAFPVVLAMLSMTCMRIVDTLFLGHFSTVAQGAVGLGWALMWPLLVTCNCSGVGVNILVAHYHGARQPERCGTVTWQGLYLSLLSWLPLLVVGLYAHQVVQLSQPSPTLAEPTEIYIRIRLIGGLPTLASFALIGFFRGLGDTRTPLIITILVNVLNAALDFLLIFGGLGLPRLGITGAALATVLSSSAGCLLYLSFFLQQSWRRHLLTGWFVPIDWQMSWKLIRVSIPVGLQKGFEVGAWTVFAVLIARLGAAEAAAHQIALQVMSVSYMAAYGMSIAAMTLVGQYLGGSEHQAARRSMVSCLGLVIGLTCGLGVLVVLARPTIMGLFTRDPIVMQLGLSLLICIVGFQVADGITQVAMAVLQGAGDTRSPMLISLLVNWGAFVPLVIITLTVFSGGLTQAWMMALTSVLFLAGIMLYRVRQGTWLQRSVT